MELDVHARHDVLTVGRELFLSVKYFLYSVPPASQLLLPMWSPWRGVGMRGKGKARQGKAKAKAEGRVRGSL